MSFSLSVSCRCTATTRVPDHMQAKLNAAYRLISWGAIPLGAIAGGLLAAALGSLTAMNLAAAGVPLATLWVAASTIPTIADLDHLDTDTSPRDRVDDAH